MRAVIQRVSSAGVTIDGVQHAGIEKGFLVLLGITHNDTESDATWLVQKIANLRVFSDAEGLMNLNLQQVNGSVLSISQFTLHASYKKGNRPSFLAAAKPDQAAPLYDFFNQKLSEAIGQTVATGVFGADMKVALVNDGPVTIVMDSKSPE